MFGSFGGVVSVGRLRMAMRAGVPRLSGGKGVVPGTDSPDEKPDDEKEWVEIDECGFLCSHHCFPFLNSSRGAKRLSTHSPQKDAEANCNQTDRHAEQDVEQRQPKTPLFHQLMGFIPEC